MDSDETNQKINAIAQSVGVTLDEEQLNIGGERAVMSPDKLVLTGVNEKGYKVILKCASAANGMEEIKLEHDIRSSLRNIPFAEEDVLMPEEIFYEYQNGQAISITEFIPQEHVFTDHDLQEQFFMALQALECQESFHATTSEHRASLRQQFPICTPDFYLENYQTMQKLITSVYPPAESALNQGCQLLKEAKELLAGYSGYLIHTDFVPHNFRINQRQLYQLDLVSLKIGNKYESWARFINFMEIHSPSLVPLLLQYIKEDRGAEEYYVLRLMRIYKATFLLSYHAQTHEKTTGNLKALSLARLDFWTTVLQSIIEDKPVPETEREKYYQKRDSLRTEKEKERQRQFTWA